MLETRSLLISVKYILSFEGKEITSFVDKTTVEVLPSIYQLGDEHTLEYIKQNTGNMQAILDYDQDQVTQIDIYQGGIKMEVHQDTDYEGNPEFNIFKQNFHKKLKDNNQPIELDCIAEPMEILEVLL